MDDSLKYGIPAGLLAFAMLFFMSGLEGTIWQLVRWFVASVLGIGIGLYFIRSRNRVYFPLGFAFLSAFNISIAKPGPDRSAYNSTAYKN